MVKLGEVCEFTSGFAFKSENLFSTYQDSSFLPVIKIGSFENQGTVLIEKCEYHKYSPDYEKYIVRSGDILIALTGATVGKTAIVKDGVFLLNQRVGLIRNNEKSLQDYLKVILFSKIFYNYCQQFAGGGAQGNISPNQILSFKIPLPPLEVQREIVAEIEGYQKLIDGCRQVVDSWKPDIQGYLDEELKQYLAEHPEQSEELKDGRRPELAEGWKMVKLGEVCEINPKKTEISSLGGDTLVSFLPMEDIGIVQDIIPIKERKLEEVYKGYTYFKENDVLVAKVTPCFENGKSGIARKLKNGIGFGSSELHVIRVSASVIPEFIYPFVSSDSFKTKGKVQMTGTGGLQRVPSSFIHDFEIPLPPLSVQQRIVAKIEAERKVIEGCRELIKTYEEKIKRVIDKVWEG